MRLVRTALILGLIPAVALAADPAPVAKTKQELRKEQRQKQAAATKAGETKPAPKPAADLIRPSADPVALARFIDEQIDRKLAEESITASPRSSDAEFLRRVSLDLTGVIPTAERAKLFLDSNDPDKRAKLVDELLASPLYGRHQADVWVPRLFPRDSANRFVLKEPFAQWFEKEFNANTPWDKLVTKLVTATGSVEDNAAVTYFLANRSVDKLTDTVSQHFLGIQLQCAQCHNHPFTGWKQNEYWGMATFFSHVQPENPKNANKGGDNSKIGVRETAARTKLKDFFPESTKVVPAKFLGGPEPKITEGQPLRPILAGWLTSKENPYFARAMVNRTWAQLFGAGFVNPIDDMHEGNEPSHPELLTGMAQAFANGGFDLKQLYRTICLSQAYQRSSKPVSGNEKDDRLFSHMALKVMAPEQLFDSLQQVNGPVADAAKMREKTKDQFGGLRDRFVQFFLAGAERSNPTEYDSGIPQALRLMNGKIGNGARAFVKPGSTPAQIVEAMFLATLSRRPTPAETTQMTAYVAKAATPAEGYNDLLWVILNSSEFSMIR